MSLAPIKEFLREVIGLDAETVGASVLEGAIRKHMQSVGTEDVTAYLSEIKISPAKTKELIESVVVNETWFFRQSDGFKYLKDIVSQAQRRFGPGKKLRILCLGCSTGEEPYSVSMVMKGMGIPSRRFIIDAVDISEKALDTARAGIYTASSFDDKQDLSYRRTHFAERGEDFEIHRDIRDSVHFIQGNVLHHTCPLSASQYDIIFCRHVIIYLCEQAREILLKRLDRLLADDGTVFIGATETSILRGRGYAGCKAPSAFAFARAALNTAGDRPRAVQSESDIGSRVDAFQERRKSVARTRVERSRPVAGADRVAPEHCWLIKGIAGDRSCEELDQYIRCDNCPVRIDYGRRFLDRQPPEEYLDTWKESLAVQAAPPNSSHREHTVIFRLGDHFFGLPSLMIKDISRVSHIHSIPGRSNEMLLGIASFSGELRLCVSVAVLVQVESAGPTRAEETDGTVYRRMVTLCHDGEAWAFAVDEIFDIQNIYDSDIQPPTGRDQSGTTYVRGTALVEDREVLLLDHQLLVESLRRGIQ